MVRSEITPVEGAVYLLNTTYYESRRLTAELRYDEESLKRRFRYGIPEGSIFGNTYLPEEITDLLDNYRQIIADPEKAQLVLAVTEQIVTSLRTPRPEVLRLRFGLRDGKLLTLKRVGQLLTNPVSQARVRQLEVSGLSILRRPSTRNILVEALKPLTT